jgi:glycosyltransferase 2 family protein
MKKAFQLGVSLALTVLVGYLIYRGVPDWGLAWRVMIQGRPHFLLAGLSFVLLHMLLRAVRWGVLLSPVKRGIALKNLFSLTLIKYTVNVIPPRAGELAASFLLAGKERISAASVIAASLLERILDMMTVVIIFGTYMAFFSHWYAPNSERGREVMLVIRSYSLKGFIVLCLGLAVLVLLLRSDQWQERFPARLRAVLSPFLDGFRSLQQGGVLFQSVLLSAAIWLVITLQLWCFMHAYLDTFPFVGSLFLMAITVVGVAIPTPGGAGGFQFFMDLALVNFFARYLSAHDPQSQAAGISNGSYLVSMVPVILAGLYCLNREGLSFGSVSRLAEQKPE